jgi:hypothetical protein
LAELIDCSGKFRIRESRRLRKPGLRVSYRDQFIFVILDRSGIGVEELGDATTGHEPGLLKGMVSRLERPIARLPVADRKSAGHFLAGVGVF